VQVASVASKGDQVNHGLMTPILPLPKPAKPEANRSAIRV
jgi:hypothetical protein